MSRRRAAQFDLAAIGQGAVTRNQAGNGGAQFAKQGLSTESIVGRIKESRTRMRLSATDVLSLKTQGVPLAVLDYLLDSDRLATADDCTMQINRRDEEAKAALQQAVQQAELMGWQRCQLSYPGIMPFPGWRPFPYRR